MDSNGKFWAFLWSLIAIVVIIITLILYLNNLKDRELEVEAVKAGLVQVQEQYCSQSSSRLLWIKESKNEQ